MDTHRSRLPLAIMVAVVAAGAATVILRPRSGLIQPAAVDATAYFSPAQLERATDFRDTQRLLSLAGLGLSGATLLLLAVRPPRVVERGLEAAGRRPLRGAALTGAGVSLALVAVDLPLAGIRHERAVDVGLSTQDWGPWLWDVAKSAGIGAALAGGGGVLALALIRRIRNWWVPAAACIVAFGALSIYIWPIVVEPLFNRFEPLPAGKLRSDVLELARRAGVDVGEVYRVDASRRTTSVNAYVGGLGRTKRVVLYDNLIEGLPEDQVRSVVAHELGHVKHHDLPRGLLWLALVAPAGAFLVQQLAQRIAGRRWPLGADFSRAGPALLLPLALSVSVVAFALQSAGNVLSREVEGRADAYSLRLTRDPEAFIALRRSLVVRNVSDPDPPGLLHVLFGTHPTPLERIGIGEAWSRED